MNRKRIPIVKFAGMLMIMLSLVVIAQTSTDTMNLQGRLTDSAGDVVTDGSYTFKIRLYDASTAGNLLYSEEQSVTVTNGIYNIILGTGTIPVAGDAPTYATLTNTFSNEDDVWMGLSVGTDSEMTPRSRITASSYAIRSINADAATTATTATTATQINGLDEAELLGPAFKSGCELSYTDANTISVSAGSIVINGIYRRNTSATPVTWTELDTGSEAAATDYFVYAVADGAGTTFTVTISASNPNWHPSGYYSAAAGSAPTGLTNYRLLGYFHNDPNSAIISNSVTTNENLNGLTLAAGIPLPGMVKVGNFAVDIYESSVFSGVTQYGIASDDYPGGLPDTGNQATGFYAVSRGDIRPSASLTWYQAAQCAANSGKRLITNAEWQIAAAGTPDDANANISGAQQDPATSWPNCVSRWNCYEMVGNLWEWVADYSTVPGWNGDVSTHTATYGTDGYWHGGLTDAGNPNRGSNDSTRPYTPGMTGNGDTAGEECGYAAVIRGGRWANGSDAGVFALGVNNAPSYWGAGIGFRCAR